MYTHVIYAFAVLDGTYNIEVYDTWADISLNGYANFVALKTKNPQLKVMISMGGWTDSTDGSGKYSRLVASTTSINTFVRSPLSFLQLYKFYGLDLDWEYPSTTADQIGFKNLIAALKTTFKSYGFLLSAAVSPDVSTIDAGN